MRRSPRLKTFLAFGISLLTLCPSVRAQSPFREWKIQHTSPSLLQDAVFGNGAFVAVGSGGFIFTSTNAIDWLEQIAVDSDSLFGATFGSGKFLIGGSQRSGAGIILASTNGIDWTRSSTFSGTIGALAYGNGRFVCADFKTIYVSPDGANWTPSDNTKMGDVGVKRLASGGGCFVALSRAFGSVSSSKNGLNWSAPKRLTTSSLDAVTFGNGRFIVAGQGANVWQSVDGENWSSQLVSTGRFSSAFWGAGFGNGLFVLATTRFDEGNVFYTSKDSLSWSAQPSPITPSGAIAYGNDTFVVVGRGIATSRDGATWSAATHHNGVSVNFNAVAEHKGEYIAMGTDEQSILVAQSSDGLIWKLRRIDYKNRINSLASDEHTVVAVGGGMVGFAKTPPILLASSDGTNWISPLGQTTSVFNAAIRATNLFVVVGQGGTIFTSSDGMDWTRRESGVSDDLHAIAYGAGRFVAVGGPITGPNYYQHSEIIASTDGVTWQRARFPPGNVLFGVTFGNGTFLAGRWFGPYLTSTNGTDWQEHDLKGAPVQGSTVTYSPVAAAGFGRGWFVVSDNYGSGWASGDLLSWTPISIPSSKWISNGKDAVAVAGSSIWKSESLHHSTQLAIYSDSIASESGEQGRFVIRRIGVNKWALNIPVSLAGTAANGIDYESINTSITLPAGQDIFEIPVRPRADNILEGAETVTLQLRSSDEFDITGSATATVWIADAGNDPRFRPSQISRQTDGSLRFVIETPVAGSYVLEASSDLKNWQIIQTVSRTGATAELRDSRPDSRQRFYRVKLE